METSKSNHFVSTTDLQQQSFRYYQMKDYWQLDAK